MGTLKTLKCYIQLIFKYLTLGKSRVYTLKFFVDSRYLDTGIGLVLCIQYRISSNVHCRARDTLVRGRAIEASRMPNVV